VPPAHRPGAATRPEPLQPHHDLTRFSAGDHAVLTEWLRDRARGSEGLSARTYVSCAADEPARVIGYYAISAALVQRGTLPGARLRRGMPDEVPVLLVGRLAVDAGWQGRGLGGAMLVDALRRCRAAADIAGARAVLAHAIDDHAAAFYARYGFLRAPMGERTLLLPMETIADLLS